MNKIFLFTFATVILLFTPNAFAQEEKKSERQFDREAFHAKRNAFITAEMGLTPEEAAAFIPLCEELRQKKFEIGRDCRKLSREIQRKKDLKDEDYLQLIDECLEVSIREAELEKEYYKQFKKILPPEKLYKYREAEFKFARHFMKMDESGGNPGPGNRRRGGDENSKK